MKACFLPFWPFLYYAHEQHKVKLPTAAPPCGGELTPNLDPETQYAKELAQANDDSEHMVLRGVQRWMPCLITVLTATVSTPTSSSTSFFMAVLVWLLRVTKWKHGFSVAILYPLIQFEFKWGGDDDTASIKVDCHQEKKLSDPMILDELSVHSTDQGNDASLNSTEECQQLLPRFPAHYHQTYVDAYHKKDAEKGDCRVSIKEQKWWEFNIVCIPLMILSSLSPRRSWLCSIIPVPIYFYRFKNDNNQPCDWRFIAFPLLDLNSYCRNHRVHFDASALLLVLWYSHIFDLVVREDENGNRTTKRVFNYCYFMVLPVFMYSQRKGSVHVALLVLIHFLWSWNESGKTSHLAILIFPLIHFIYYQQTIYFMTLLLIWLRIRPEDGSCQMMLLLLFWISCNWGPAKYGFGLVILPFIWLQYQTISAAYADDPSPHQVQRKFRALLFPLFFVESKTAMCESSVIVSLLMLLWFRNTPNRRDYAILPICYYNTDMCK